MTISDHTDSPRCIKKKLCRAAQQRKVYQIEAIDPLTAKLRPMCVKKKLCQKARQRKTGKIKNANAYLKKSSTDTRKPTELKISTGIVIKRKVRGKTIESLRSITTNMQSLQATVCTTPPSESPIFEDIDAAWEFYMDPSSEFHDIPNDFEPIPFHLAIKGAAVDADGYEESKSTSEASLAIKEAIPGASLVIKGVAVDSDGRIEESKSMPGRAELKKAPATTAYKNKKVQKIKRSSKQREVITNNANKSVGPSSRQMKVIQRMIIYLESVADKRQILRKFCKVVEICLRRHTKGDPYCRHLPGTIFEVAVDCIGAQVFRDAFVNSKSIQHHTRLSESIGTTLRSVFEPAGKAASDFDEVSGRVDEPSTKHPEVSVDDTKVDADHDFWEWAESQV